MKPKIHIARLLAGLIALPALPALSQNVVRVSLNADIRGTNPGVNRDDNTDSVVLHLMEGLVAYKEDASVGPMLAERIDVSADGLSYRFKLRAGIKFHNGAPLSADDVVWAWHRYLDPKTGWRCLGEFDGKGRLKIVSVNSVAKDLVQFKLDRPSALFLQTMARTDCGGSGIMHRSSVAADGSWKEPIGTGPYRLKEWKRAEYVLLERFSGYVPRSEPMDGYTGRKEALMEQVRFMVIPDATAARTALLSGNIDVMSNASATEYKQLAASPKVVALNSATMAMQTLLFQIRDPLLANLKLRQAIAAAIDTESLAEAVTEGRSPRNNSVVATVSSYYGAVEKRSLSADLNKARALLREAGYKGQPIKLLTNRRYTEGYDAAIVMQAMLQAAGLKVELEVLEWGTQLERYISGNYQLMSFPFSSRLDPALAFDAVMGAKSKTPNKVWDNPQAQAVLTRAFEQSDRKERQAIFDDLHLRMLAELPLLVLFNLPDYAAHTKAVTGFKSWVTSKPRLWGVLVQR